MKISDNTRSIFKKFSTINWRIRVKTGNKLETISNMEKDWWSIENLRREEERTREIDDIEELDSRGDLGSYRRVLLGDNFEDSMLNIHNEISPRGRISFCHSFLEISKKKAMNILDVGCGMGFTTEELAKFYHNSDVTGVDISEDAINYANRTHKSARFICEAVDPKKEKIGSFDLIFVFEFYPFTRTNNLDVHVSYLNYLISSLKKSGKLIIVQQWNNPESIYKNYKIIKNKLSKHKFRLINVPHQRVLNLITGIKLSQMIDYFLCLLLRKKTRKGIIIDL